MGLKPQWRCWYDEPINGKVECRICQMQFSYKSERLYSHLGYDGAKNPGVGRCKLANAHVLSQFRDSNGKSIPPRLTPQVSMTPECSAATGGSAPLPATPTSPPADSCGGSQNEGPSIKASTNTPRASTDTLRASQCSGGSRALHQSTIQSQFALGERALVDQAWASFFYEQSIPFAAARSKTFKHAVSATANLRKPYLPPSYHDLRKRLLDEKKKALEIQLGNLLGPQIESFGCTISTDGWSNVQNRPLMNVMKICPAGEEFIGSVDASGNIKDAKYVAEMLGKYIEAVGPKNVVQICTDNASVMKSAVDILIEKWPHIYFQGCAAHVLNLLLGDWGKVKWVKEVVDDVREIVKFVKNRHMPLAIFRDHERKFQLLSPGATRFATSFIMVERFVKAKRGLQQMVIDPRWDVYVRTMRQRKERESINKAREVKRLINDDRLWTSCNNFLHLVWPVLLALREFDGKKPRTDKAYKVMKNLEKHIMELQYEPFKLPVPVFEALHRQFKSRWEMMRTDIHLAAALLNPRLVDDKELRVDTNAQAGLNRVFIRLAGPEHLTELLNEFHAFYYKLPPYSDAWNVQKYDGAPHLWWHMVGATVGKLLPPIARRVLAQVVSSSSCERNWSSYSFVHNRSRNRLHAKRAEDLVYVYTNSKILAGMPEKKDAAEEEWYRQNRRAEDSDSEGRGDSNNESDDDPVQNMQAAAEAEEADEAELRAKNCFYDDDQYELATWYDTNFPDRSRHDDHNNDSEDREGTPIEGGGGDEEDEEPLARFMDGTGRLNSENILGGGPNATAPVVAEEGEVNAPPIRDSVGSGSRGVEAPTVPVVAHDGRAVHANDDSVHGREGNEGVRNDQGAEQELGEFHRIRNEGIALDLPMQPRAEPLAQLATARPQVAGTGASGSRAPHTPLTYLYTDDSSDDNRTLQAEAQHVRRVAENRALVASRLREVSALEDTAPAPVEVPRARNRRPLPQVAPLRKRQSNDRNEIRASPAVEPFNPGRTPEPLAPFLPPPAPRHRIGRRARPLPTELTAAASAGDFRALRNAQVVAAEGSRPSKESTRMKKRTTTPSCTGGANLRNKEDQGRPSKRGRRTAGEVDEAQSTDSSNSDNTTSHDGDDGTSGAEVPNDSNYEP